MELKISSCEHIRVARAYKLIETENTVLSLANIIFLINHKVRKVLLHKRGPIILNNSIKRNWMALNYTI